MIRLREPLSCQTLTKADANSGWIIAGGIVGGGWAGMGSFTITSWFKGEKQFKLPRKYGGYFRNEADHRDFVSIGTAAGVTPM